MQTHRQSLLDYLRIPNPEVSGEACPGGTNSMSSRNSYEIPRRLREWQDFGFDTMNAIYNEDLRKVLEQDFILQDFSAIPEFPFRKFFDENSLESLLIKWNHSIVSEALEKAQGVLDRVQDQDHVYMVRGGQAESSGAKRKWKPDWGCVKCPVSASLEKRKNLLPGDTKVSTKWSSSVIRLVEANPGLMLTDKMRPLRQIYSYCLWNETRYGYIITDAELVVLRVCLEAEFDSQKTFESFGSMNSESQGSLADRARHTGILEYKVIPWTAGQDGIAQTTDGMTVNLALWWLHLIAIGNTNIDLGENYAALKDAVWGSADGNQMRSLGHLVVSEVDELIPQPSSTPSQKGKKRSKSTAKEKKRSRNERSSKGGINKRGSSKGRKSAQNSFRSQ